MFAVPQSRTNPPLERVLGPPDGLREHRAPAALRDAVGAAAQQVKDAIAELAEHAEAGAGHRCHDAAR